MNDDFLKLNDDKTELLNITTREELSNISDTSTKVGDQSISPSDDPPRNLGVIFDYTCWSTYNQIVQKYQLQSIFSSNDM